MELKEYGYYIFQTGCLQGGKINITFYLLSYSHLPPPGILCSKCTDETKLCIHNCELTVFFYFPFSSYYFQIEDNMKNEGFVAQLYVVTKRGHIK